MSCNSFNYTENTPSTPQLEQGITANKSPRKPQPKTSQITLWRKVLQYQLQEILNQENTEEYVRNRPNWSRILPEDILKGSLLRTDSALKSLSPDNGFYVPGEGKMESYRLPSLEDLIDFPDFRRLLIPLAGINLGSRTVNWEKQMMFTPAFRKEFGTYTIVGDGNCLFR